MVWITDADSKCTYLSKQWYDFTGRTPEQDLGYGWLENIHPDDLPETARVYKNAVENKGPLNVDYRLRRQDGVYRWTVDLGYPRFSKTGEFTGYIGTVTDIHEKLVAERELKTLQERFQRSTAATDLGVWYCDLPFDELIWNREVKNHFFLSPDARVDIKLFYELIHPEDREMTRAAIEDSNLNHTPYDIVYRTVDPRNQKRVKYIRAMGWTDYDKSGAPIHFDGVTLDITQSKINEENLKQSRDAAQAASVAKTSFLTNMSHEIRTPLGAILGFAELLKEKALPDTERDRFVEIITRNGKALTSIIDDILDLAKVEAGKLETEKIAFRLQDLASDIVDLFRERCKEKGILLKLAEPENLPALVLSDPIRLRQILINLIGNAVKFTDAGRVTVAMRSIHVGSQLQIEIKVADTGIGISEEARERLFQAFSQADNSTTRKFGGTGLGLALSQRLAKALGGEITVSNNPDSTGSVFALKFFNGNAADVKAVLPAESVPASPSPSAALPLVGTQVLLADDSVDNQLLIKRILKKNGASVEVANNGTEALALGLTGSFDIILMDVQMPEMDGYQATRELRKAGYMKPIVALTAHAMSEERARTKAAGCDVHLTKPIDPSELIATIRSLQT